MAEYIERETALRFVFDACAECMDACEEFDGIYADCNQCMLEGVKLKLRDLPADDVRPVVTCADCKHWTRIKEDCILASCDLDALVRCEDFYCANGEKREES